jgi:hypothetical protein
MSFYNQGVLLHQKGKLQEALGFYDLALQQQPNHAPALNNRGAVLQSSGQHDEALLSYQLAVKFQPDFVDAINNLGQLQFEMGRVNDAIVHLNQALELVPHHPAASNNLGNIYLYLGDFEKAAELFEAALKAEPQNIDFIINLGNLHYAKADLDAALGCYNQAIAIAPNDARAYSFKSMALLLKGDYRQGWQLHEWRWKKHNFTSPQRNFAARLWLGGQSLEGKTLLLHSEQGFGDSLQFCRFIAMVRQIAKPKQLVVEVPASLLELFQCLQGVDTWIVKGQSLPDFDFHCPFMSLPLALQIELDNIPFSQTPYLFADQRKSAQWASRLQEKKHPRIGLVWSSVSKKVDDHLRSLSFREFAQALPDQGFEYHCLQQQIKPDDIEDFNRRGDIAWWGPQLIDFSETAALCAQLDLVISVDTSVAHLAAAMGKKTYVLLPFVPDWRWLMNRPGSPWYASISLFRQTRDRNWMQPLQQIYNLMG